MTGNRFGRYRVLVIALLVLLAVLMIWSRGQRTAQRIHLHPAGEGPAGDAGSGADFPESTPDQLPGMETPSDMSPDWPPAELLLGRTDPVRDTAFVQVDVQYASREGMFMHREAYRAFTQMHQAAMTDGVNLVIVSAMRTFDHQKRIWENKWNGRQVLDGGILAPSIGDPVERAREILRFSAMPGTSRHHWGTDIDLNALQNSYFASGTGKRVYDWLQENAASFGFCQPYTAVGPGRPAGYEEEKWHWSYLPVASAYLRAFEAGVTYADIAGFDGWETARQLGVIENYVLGIAPECR